MVRFHSVHWALTAVLALASVAVGAQPGVKIVVARSAAPPEQFAAKELARYLAAMGNPMPEIVTGPAPGDIYIGLLPASMQGSHEIETRLKGKDPDSFVIRSFGRTLVIIGNSPRANLFGTYGYLESLGTRWYFPGVENEVVPQTKVALENYDIVEIPSFRKRGIVVFATTPGLEDLVDFAAKKRINTIGLHLLPSMPPFADAGYDAAARAIGPRGLTIDIERHFFGERFCPDDVRTLADERANFRKYLAILPSTMNDFFLWAADKYLAPCRSELYKNYSVSDVVLWFSNQMARTLREVRPQGRFAYLAYLGTEEPPENIKPESGVFLEWAPIRQSFAKSIDDPSSALSRDYRRKLERNLQIFKASGTQVLGYWLDDTLFSRTNYGRLPYSPDALRRELAYYHRLGIPDITTFGVIVGRDYFSAMRLRPYFSIHSYCGVSTPKSTA